MRCNNGPLCLSRKQGSGLARGSRAREVGQGMGHGPRRVSWMAFKARNSGPYLR